MYENIWEHIAQPKDDIYQPLETTKSSVPDYLGSLSENTNSLFDAIPDNSVSISLPDPEPLLPNLESIGSNESTNDLSQLLDLSKSSGPSYLKSYSANSNSLLESIPENPVSIPLADPGPILPNIKPIGSNDLYDANTGMIGFATDSFLQNKTVDPLGNICHLGGMETGYHVDCIGQIRDVCGNLKTPGIGSMDDSNGMSGTPFGSPALAPAPFGPPPMGAPGAF